MLSPIIGLFINKTENEALVAHFILCQTVWIRGNGCSLLSCVFRSVGQAKDMEGLPMAQYFPKQMEFIFNYDSLSNLLVIISMRKDGDF